METEKDPVYDSLEDVPKDIDRPFWFIVKSGGRDWYLWWYP